jgi:hypothetical protein
MIVYIGGDGHAAAAQAASRYVKANDDPALFYLGAAPHPANLAVSWAQRWVTAVRAGLHIEAQAEIDNLEILRRARLWLETHAQHRPMVIVGWTDFDCDWADHQQQIWQFHCYLQENQCPHLFFNTTQSLTCVDTDRDWGAHYIDPCNPQATYVHQLTAAGYQTHSRDEPYYGSDAHGFWFQHLLNHIVTHGLV